MICYEDKELEELVLSGDSCIAIPIEIFRSEDNEIKITVYSSFYKIAEEFVSKFKDDPLDANALNWLDDELYAIAEELGYEHCADDIHYVCEYESNNTEIPWNTSIAKIINNYIDIADYNTELIDDIIIDDIAAVVVENNKVVAIACANDVSFDDDSIELFVETDEKYRGRGYGTAVVAKLTEYYLKNNIGVRYKCAKNNIASVRLAEKCGFRKCGERYSYVCYAKEEN